MERGSNKDIEDLLGMFDWLDLQTMSRTDPHLDLFTIDEHKAFKYSNTALSSRIPDEYEDIASVRNYFYNMARIHSHFSFLLRKLQGMSKINNPSPQNPLFSDLDNSPHCVDESVLLESSKCL